MIKKNMSRQYYQAAIDGAYHVRRDVEAALKTRKAVSYAISRSILTLYLYRDNSRPSDMRLLTLKQCVVVWLVLTLSGALLGVLGSTIMELINV